MRKNCCNDREKLLKFEAEGREFAKNLGSLEQFFLTVGQNNFGNKMPFSTQNDQTKPNQTLFTNLLAKQFFQQNIQMINFPYLKRNHKNKMSPLIVHIFKLVVRYFKTSQT